MTQFPVITSPRNEKIKSAIKLRRRKHRGRQGRTLIDGARELFRAVSAGIHVEEIYFCSTLCHTAESRRLLAQLDELEMGIYEVTENVFEKLAYGERTEGFIGVAIPPEVELDDLVLPENPLLAVVEGIEKPGNLGAILRSADGHMFIGTNANFGRKVGHRRHSSPLAMTGTPLKLHFLT